jgi:hypothetical protein
MNPLFDYLQTSGNALMRGVRGANAVINPFQYLSPQSVAGMLPGGGVVEGNQDMRAAGEALRQGSYGRAGALGLQGTVNTALDLFPATAALPAVSMVSRQLKGADTPGVISTRLPTAVKATEDPFETYLPIDTAAMKATPEAFEHNINLFKDTGQYPGVLSPAARKSKDPDKVARDVKDTAVGNLLFLHDMMPEAIRDRSRLWYDGAQRLASDMSKEYGIPTNSVAGVMAALSPQKDWYQNVSLADRVLSTMKKDAPWSPEMQKTMERIYAKPDLATIANNIRGKSLADLDDPVEKAAWIRAYDEAHNPRSHRLVNPEGTYGDLVRSANGLPSGTGWGSLSEIAKAVNAAESGGDAKRISELMGERHKVRNFYNNILAPNAKTGDVTIDTHAVAADLLQPLSGNTVPVAHNFKNSLAKNFQPAEGFVNAKGSSATGAQGTYGLHADAYREAAAERGVLPREMQSITWEGVRGLFPDVFKTPKNAADVRAIWQAVSDGSIDANTARRMITERSGGMRLPTWAQ